MRTHVAPHRIQVLAVTPLLCAVLAGVASPAPAVAAAGWTGPAPRLASVTGGGILFGVAATSARDAWAVGLSGRARTPATLIERWNGAAWKRVPSPSSASGGLLNAVAVTSAGRAWAAGQTGSLVSSKPATLIERWNGTRWKRVPSPNPARGGTLYGLAVTSARSAWAVGQTGGVFSQRPKTLIERWNGTTWKRVPSPNAATPGSWLGAVAATSARSAWAVGCACNGPAPKTLIEHWNGTRWKLMPSPNPAGGGGSVLYGVAVTSTHNAWAVGCTGCFRTKPETLILHWNGSAWKRVTSPNPAGGGNLSSVAVTSAENAWAVGWTGDPNNPRPMTVIEHWNGTRWRRVLSASPAGGAQLFGVAAASARSAWTVGETGGLFTTKPKTVALHWNGTAWN
jgi:hypothetical protein